MDAYRDHQRLKLPAKNHYIHAEWPCMKYKNISIFSRRNRLVGCCGKKLSAVATTTRIADITSGSLAATGTTDFEEDTEGA